MPVTPSALTTAFERADQFLLDSPVLEALVARRESERWSAEDDETVAELAQELVDLQSEDGSWGGHLAHTAETLTLLGDLLASQHEHPAASRAVDWLKSRQNKPGAFTTRCEPDLHAAELCSHVMSGFFSPAADHVLLEGTALGRGVLFRTDRDARVGTSALALRGWLRWAEPDESARAHIAGLIRIANGSFRPGRPQLLGSAAVVESLITLCSTQRTAEITAAFHGALSRLSGTQRADGSFSDISTFAVLDVLLRSLKAGYSSPVFDSAIARAVEMLVVTQQANGSWGKDVTPYFTLIGWRALRAALPPKVAR